MYVRMYGTAWFKLQEYSRALLYTHYTNSKKFMACLRVYEKLMTLQLLTENKETCHKSKQAHNLNTLYTWH